jgi:hypothetical protein
MRKRVQQPCEEVLLAACNMLDINIDVQHDMPHLLFTVNMLLKEVELFIYNAYPNPFFFSSHDRFLDLPVVLTRRGVSGGLRRDFTPLSF